jgi:UDP-3-O-[3-hydroxymyristoyl] glucosamine N-acyltransferase
VSENTVVIVTKNPKYAFLKVINRFFLKDTPMYRIDPSATISEDVNIMGPVSIGQNVVILGAGEIGEGTIIHPNVTMRGPFKIGKNVEIHPGCVVGYDGFGYGKTPQSEYEKFPHLGQVIIEDDVEIGANSCIDRGILTDTIIGHHTKIDKACLIAHGVIIGRSCMVAGFTNIGGSVVVGDYVWLSPKATILNGISIGHHATVGIGSVVLRSVKAGETVFGNPAKVIKRAVAS